MLNAIINNKNIKLLYIITTNYTFLFAQRNKFYLNLFNIIYVIY